MHADDIALLFLDKTEADRDKAINHNANLSYIWLCKNDLILNSNWGKTEFMIFDTAARSNKIENELIIEINSKPISNTGKYKYFGIQLDPSLTDQVYKGCKQA